MEALRAGVEAFNDGQCDCSVFLAGAQICLDSQQGGTLEIFLNQPENKELLAFAGFDLLPMCIVHCCDDTADDLHLASIQKLVDHIAECCSPREVCLAAAVAMDANTLPPSVLQLLFGTMNTALSRLANSWPKCFSTLLPCLLSQLEHLPRPSTDLPQRLRSGTIASLVAHARRNAKVSPNISSELEVCQGCLSALLDLVCPLVRSCQQLAVELGEDAYQKQLLDCSSPSAPRLLVCLLFSLLASPLSDISLANQATNRLLLVIQRCTQFLMDLRCQAELWISQPTMPSAVRSASEEDDKETDSLDISPLGRACLSYILIAENYCPGWMPTVYSAQHLLRCNLGNICFLLSRPSSHARDKGLSLAWCMIHRLSPSCLSLDRLHEERYQNLLQDIVRVATDEPEKKLRRSAASLVKMFLQCFSLDDCCQLSSYILSPPCHPGMAGLLMCSVKDHLQVSSESSWCSSHHFLAFFQQICSLEDEPNVLEESDRFMAVLNFLRFLLAYELAHKDQVFASRHWMHVQRTFTEPLWHSLHTTQQAVRQELEVMKTGVTSSSQSIFNFSGLPVGQQLEALQMGLHTFDLMLSVLARVNTLADQVMASAKAQSEHVS